MERFKFLFVLILMTFSALGLAQGLPQFETRSISGGFTVNDSATETVHLSHTRFIKNIIVEAQGVNRDSMIEVMVNGEVKGTIYAPGRDPSYVVTIGETTSSIQFRHRSGDRMRIHKVTATMSVWAGRAPFPTGGRYFPGADEVLHLAHRALVAVETIRPYSTLEEEQTYLLPIKKKAGQIIIMAGARGNQSRKTTEALVALQNQIDFSNAYINLMMEQDGLFEAAVELLSIQESIDDLLN